jgi:hypothetical protein
VKTKADGVPNAFVPYKQREIDLILSLTPTYSNVRNLSVSLGRSQDAIITVFSMAYSGKWLKGMLGATNENTDNVVTKIARTKKKLGIFVGHEPG